MQAPRRLRERADAWRDALHALAKHVFGCFDAPHLAARSCACAGLAIAIALGFFSAIAPVAIATAAPVYSYFPTAVQNDGKMLCVAGSGLQTLSGNTVTLSFSVDNTLGSFNLGFFDGASNSTWDMSNAAYPTKYILYADPLGDGSGASVVTSWTDTQMSGNAWTDFAVNTSAAARAPSGNYFYRLLVQGTSPATTALNTFKMRVEGYTYIIPTTLFGYIGSMPAQQTLVYPNYPTLTPTTYDGTWDFYMNVAQTADHIDIWDGDFDVAGDTNDANTTYTPAFDPGVAVTEGVNAGSPVDDSANTDYLRTPAVRYTVYAPDGASYANLNPSGNTEWELFRMSTVTSDPAIADYKANALPSGMYDVKVTGVDMHNLNALRFEHPIMGVDASGRPMPPPAPFLVGDTVYNDVNHNGVQDGGETGIAGVVVSLCDPISGRVIANGMTDSTGAYSLNSWNGTYKVVIDAMNYLPGGALALFTATSPNPAEKIVTVANANVTSADFGFYVAPAVGLSISPDRTGSIAPSQTITYTFTISNNRATGGTFSLSATSTLGWITQIKNAGGSAITSVPLSAFESTTVVVSIAVPSAATTGTQDTMKLTGTLVTDSSVTASARGVTTVHAGLSATPNNASDGSPLTTVDYDHTITNSWPTTRTITLTAVSSHAWVTGIFAADGVTPVTTITVGPNGASQAIVVKVTVPTGVASGTVDVATLTATTGATTAKATDTTTARTMAVYPDATYSVPVSTYTIGDTVYARVPGLQTNRQYYFVWTDSQGTIVRTSATANPNASGISTDSYPTTAGDPAGVWTVTCWRSNGANTASTQFTVISNAAISALFATNASRVGMNVDVASTLHDFDAAAIINSTATYTIWWDTNGDGMFGSGDTYIDSTGTPRVWNGAAVVSTHVSNGIDVQGTGYATDVTWAISNAAFPNQGTYNIIEAWTASNGTLLDTKTTQFFSVPTLGEWMTTVEREGTRSLPIILLAGAVWLAITMFFYAQRKWLRMYLFGAFGFVMFALFFSQALNWDSRLAAIEASQAAAIAQLLHMRIELLGASGLAIRNPIGWGVFDIGIECSALLELAAFVGLVAFYPGFGSPRKAGSIAIGLAATYAINIVRILIIVGMIAALGNSWVFIAHAVIGRIFFFVGVVGVYWMLMTRPTVHLVGAKIVPETEEEVLRG